MQKIIAAALGARRKHGAGLLAALLLLTVSLGAAGVSFAQDPATPTAAPAAPAESTAAAPSYNDLAGGAATGGAGDVVDAAGTAIAPSDAEKQSEPYATKLSDGVGQNRIGINIMWTLITGFMVMFMQAGFAMVETGFCRAKHAAHVIMTNFLVYPIGMLGFWLCGFAFMFGSLGVNPNLGIPADTLNSSSTLSPFIGLKGFMLSGEGMYSPAIYTLFLFQMVFMDTTVTIPTGSMAERWKFSSFIIYGFFISMFLYPIYGHWVWGGGWLATMGTKFHLGHGAVDFAGSGVVHAVGGFAALAGAKVLGPRIGKYDSNGKPRAMPGHNIPMAIIGTFILAFGWFGFNPGSTFGASGAGNLRIGIIAANTMLASAGGAIGAMCFWSRKSKGGYPDPSMIANGFLAGLVAITAPCAFTSSGWSVVIGLLAGVLVCVSIEFWEKKGIDDPVGAISVHGVCGVFGLLCVGIFSDGTYGGGWNGVDAALGGVKGLLYGDFGQLMAQIIDSVVVIAWAYGMSLIFFKVQNNISPIRSSREDEIAGLDVPEMGVVAYTSDDGMAGA